MHRTLSRVPVVTFLVLALLALAVVACGGGQTAAPAAREAALFFPELG